MTTETMEAGREVDALVHTQIMGGDEATRSGGMAYYSTDIAAAWPIAERLPYFQLYRHADGRWTAIAGVERHSSVATKATADTAPLAICLVALAFNERAALTTTTDAAPAAGEE